MSRTFPEPRSTTADPSRLFLDYLDFYRATIAAKLAGLSDAELRHSRVPSGWTPIELLKHLVFMERRWLVWGFEAEAVDAPWGDRGPEDRWQVADDESVDDLVAALHRGGARTREIVEASDLAALGGVGGRFAADPEPPTLIWILFHVLQEYARHAGHLDIVRELADGAVGE
ncbi:MAG TPA: DinB family protein [Nocardioidaceae bacterium]|nr:DinB family protein [Nocardioidaceae bacterium]